MTLALPQKLLNIKLATDLNKVTCKFFHLYILQQIHVLILFKVTLKNVINYHGYSQKTLNPTLQNNSNSTYEM